MNENEMTDSELEQLELSTALVEDRLDRLELLRQALNSSRVEQMYAIKRAQPLHSACPYYKKAVRLFQSNEQIKLLDQLDRVLREFDDVR